MSATHLISPELQTFIETAFEKLKQEMAEAFADALAELQHQQKLAQPQAAS